MSPTARTLMRLRAGGWTAATVEHWNPHARIRHDLFGCIDVLAIRADEPALAIQACTTGDQSTRIAKVMAEPRAWTWLKAGGRLEVWGWAKRGPRGARKRWIVTVTPIMLAVEAADALESALQRPRHEP